MNCYLKIFMFFLICTGIFNVYEDIMNFDLILNFIKRLIFTDKSFHLTQQNFRNEIYQVKFCQNLRVK